MAQRRCLGKMDMLIRSNRPDCEQSCPWDSPVPHGRTQYCLGTRAFLDLCGSGGNATSHGSGHAHKREPDAACSRRVLGSSRDVLGMFSISPGKPGYCCSLMNIFIALSAMTLVVTRSTPPPITPPTTGMSSPMLITPFCPNLVTRRKPTA